jgi:hypothetical protein
MYPGFVANVWLVCDLISSDRNSHCLTDTEVQEKVEVQQVQIKMEKDLAITDG